MANITIRCNKRERDKYFLPTEHGGGEYEWKVGELKFAVNDSEIAKAPKTFLIECYFCGDLFGVLLHDKHTTKLKLANYAFPISKIAPEFASPAWGAPYTHTIWFSDGHKHEHEHEHKHKQERKHEPIGKVSRWDCTDIYGYSGEKEYNRMLNLIENPKIRLKMVDGWEKNYFINNSNRKLALWYIKMNPGCSMLDLFEFFNLNKITSNLTWLELLVKGLINEGLVKTNKNKLFMSYFSSPDNIELEITERGKAIEIQS